MPQLSIRRSAPGCLCCTGNLVLRVGLNRLLRERPERLYISVGPGTHLPVLSTMLTSPPYDAWLTVSENISL
jgi:G3E family GTPase